MPDRRPRKLSATRSPARIARRRTGDLGERAAARASRPRRASRRNSSSGSSRAEDGLHHVQPGDHAGRPLLDHGPRAGAGRHDRRGGQVAAPTSSASAGSISPARPSRLWEGSMACRWSRRGRSGARSRGTSWPAMFARGGDPYAGADLERLGSVMAACRPDDAARARCSSRSSRGRAFGPAGWAAGRRRGRRRGAAGTAVPRRRAVGLDGLLVACYGGVLGMPRSTGWPGGEAAYACSSCLGWAPARCIPRAAACRSVLAAAALVPLSTAVRRRRRAARAWPPTLLVLVVVGAVLISAVVHTSATSAGLPPGPRTWPAWTRSPAWATGAPSTRRWPGDRPLAREAIAAQPGHRWTWTASRRSTTATVTSRATAAQRGRARARALVRDDRPLLPLGRRRVRGRAPGRDARAGRGGDAPGRPNRVTRVRDRRRRARSRSPSAAELSRRA